MDTWLRDLIEATAWEMEKPKAYGTFHLTFTLVGFVLCVFLAWRLRNLGEKGSRRLLLGVGAFLIVTEIYKQLFYYYHIGGGSYQWWIFPFQLCSIPMYFCVIAPLLRRGKLQHAMFCFMTTFNLLGGAISFAEPSGLVHEYWTLTLHAFLWHMCLVFVGFYLIASGRGARTLRDYRYAAITFGVLCVVAFGINLSLFNVSEGSINMFYVGPRNSPLIVFKQISEAAGWYVSTLLYIPAVCLGSFLIFLPRYLRMRRARGADHT